MTPRNGHSAELPFSFFYAVQFVVIQVKMEAYNTNIVSNYAIPGLPLEEVAAQPLNLSNYLFAVNAIPFKDVMDYSNPVVIRVFCGGVNNEQRAPFAG